VDVRWAPSGFEFTHAKTVLIDAEKALIMTMNLTQSSAKTNREYIATDADADDIADLEKIFAADYANKPIKLASKLVVSPFGGNKLFSARDHLEAFIASATSSLDVEVQSLSDTGIVDAIVKAHARKVDVHVVIDADTANTSGEENAIAKLKAAGVPLKALGSPDIHAKSIVVDDARVFVGSQNMTITALDKNREIGVLSDAKSEAIKVREAIRTDFGDGTEL
jgi:phosphatidylserine/phosphatidylglycerophosphate/cardiolipin synthase-like enzyme